MTADLSDFFQKNVLESIVLFLATATDREPLHASAVIRNKTALLICGSSGSGKTTLAYSLYKRGADILAESAIYISRNNGWKLWGDPLGFNFSRDACELFPELLNIPEDSLPDGRIKIPLKLPLNGESDRRKWVFSGNIIFVFPKRTGGSHSRICEISHAEMLKRVTSNRESGFDLSKTFENTMSEIPVISSYIIETGSDIMQTTNLLETLFALAYE
jgi:ABC-type dipeptide/oligopeptide/nickel transport system ATPase component